MKHRGHEGPIAEAGGHYAVVRASELPEVGVAQSWAQGLRETSLVGAATGAAHLEIAIADLEPGGTVPGHVHPYEESFYVREGEVLHRVAERTYRLGPGDFGVAPIGTPHAWRNVGDRPASWLQIRAPQPRPVGDSPRGIFEVPGFLVAEQDAREPAESDPTNRFVGCFREDQMPVPGPVAARGVNAYNVRNVATRWMVDDTIGATHHIVFRGLMIAPPVQPPPGHYHAFEEVYHVLGGDVEAYLNDDVHRVGPGDTVFAGVNAVHGFLPLGDEPMRWIETMSPRPPERDSMLFPRQWEPLKGMDRDR